jgi:hypothetical protein
VTAATSRAPRSARPEHRSGRRLPFWGLQAVELAIALALVDIAAHIDHATLLLLTAGALGLLALTARGPLGVLRICPPRAHAVLCAVLAGLVVVALVLPSLRPGAAGIAVLALTMAGLVRLATLTRTDGNPLPSGFWPSEVIDASATVAGERMTAPPPFASSDAAGATAPGTAAADDPSAPAGAGPQTPATDRLARLAGEAVATGQKAARRHRPAIEAGARRGIRSLGRAVGRLGR